MFYTIRSGNILADRLSTCKLIELLEPSFSFKLSIRCSSDANHWPFVDLSIGHTTDAIGHSWSTDSHHNTWSLGKIPDHSSCISCCLFISEAEIFDSLSLNGHAKFIARKPNNTETVSEALTLECLSDNIVSCY